MVSLSNCIYQFVFLHKPTDLWCSPCVSKKLHFAVGSGEGRLFYSSKSDYKWLCIVCSGEFTTIHSPYVRFMKTLGREVLKNGRAGRYLWNVTAHDMTGVCISSQQLWLPAQDKDSQNSSTDGEGPPNPTLGGAIGSGWLPKGVCVWGSHSTLLGDCSHSSGLPHTHVHLGN